MAPRQQIDIVVRDTTDQELSEYGGSIAGAALREVEENSTHRRVIGPGRGSSEPLIPDRLTFQMAARLVRDDV